MLEDTEQKAVVRWLHRRGLLFCHVPNGGYRRKGEAARLKAMGVVTGVPDLLIFTEPRTALEMKTLTGKTSKAQKKWLAQLEGLGWSVYVARGAVEAIRLLTIRYGAA